MAVPKLFQWLLVLGPFMSVWLAYILGMIRPAASKPLHDILLILPLYILISFACYALAVVGYRLATFNDCKEAAEELNLQIQQAHKELEKKGYKYSSDWKK